MKLRVTDCNNMAVMFTDTSANCDIMAGNRYQCQMYYRRARQHLWYNGCHGTKCDIILVTILYCSVTTVVCGYKQ